jgi:galactokinase
MVQWRIAFLGFLSARMTGGGVGGCSTSNMVGAESVDGLSENVVRGFQAGYRTRSEIYRLQCSSGRKKDFYEHV